MQGNGGKKDADLGENEGNRTTVMKKQCNIFTIQWRKLTGVSAFLSF